MKKVMIILMAAMLSSCGDTYIVERLDTGMKVSVDEYDGVNYIKGDTVCIMNRGRSEWRMDTDCNTTFSAFNIYTTGVVLKVK